MAREHVNGTARAGEIVRYEDMANPARTFMVVEKQTEQVIAGLRFPGQYVVADASGERHASDLRQRGWTFATEEEAIEHMEESGMTTGDAQAYVESLQLMRERGLTA